MGSDGLLFVMGYNGLLCIPGAVLKPFFTFYIKPEHVRNKISAFLWSRKIRESTAKGPAKG